MGKVLEKKPLLSGVLLLCETDSSVKSKVDVWKPGESVFVGKDDKPQNVTAIEGREVKLYCTVVKLDNKTVSQGVCLREATEKASAFALNCSVPANFEWKQHFSPAARVAMARHPPCP